MLFSLDLRSSLTVRVSGTQGAGPMIDSNIPLITDKYLRTNQLDRDRH